MAFISKGIELFHKGVGGNPATALKNMTGAVVDETYGVRIDGLQEVGELSAGSAAGGFDKIEVTTLQDRKHVYVNGLVADEGDADSITFTMLYDPTLYEAILGIQEMEQSYTNGSFLGSEYYVTIPNPTAENADKVSAFRIRGMSGIKLNSASVNAALTMVLTVTPNDEITFTA
jgi:hypothetical protein